MNIHFTVVRSPRGMLLLFYGLLVCLFTEQCTWKRNILSWLIHVHVGRCFGFLFHNFVTGSDGQKFRVSAYRQDRFIGR